MAAQKPERSTPVSKDAVRSAPYSYRAPSPPFIHIPILQRRSRDHDGAMDLLPSLEHLDPTQLTSRDLSIITRNTMQLATDRAASWEYEQRRQAQSILDFLYLGPTSVVRDHDFLRREAMTMVLVARDARMATAGKRLSVEQATAALGMAAHYVDIDGPHGIVRALPDAIRLINDHLLAVYHAQAHARVDPASLRRGKVLVVCESGNDRSAAIVAGYIMAMFGQSMIPTIQFTSVQRFCCSFDEDVKRTLQTWEDILRARRAVAAETQPSLDDCHDQPLARQQLLPNTTTTTTNFAGAGGGRAKRGLDDMMGMGQDATSGKQGGGPATDIDRFIDRDPFAPFRDANPSYH